MALATVRRLLAPMALAPHVSAVVHPLQRALEAPAPDLRRDAADTLCALALALGPDLALFVPALRKVQPQLWTCGAWGSVKFQPGGWGPTQGGCCCWEAC